MSEHEWQLQKPLSAIIFDCDGTLSTIEGIDELARKKGVYHEVAALTEEAMGKTGMNRELYEKRLRLVNPLREDVFRLGQQYFDNKVMDAVEVIKIFQRLNKSIYIVSAGLHPAVRLFGELLNIPNANIFAVDIQFDDQGQFLNFDLNSPLVFHDGKLQIAEELMRHHSSILHIGDGLNDFITQNVVTRFVGYGGIFYRENLAKRCDYYICTESLAPLLALVFTADELSYLHPQEKRFYQKGLEAILSGQVQINAS